MAPQQHAPRSRAAARPHGSAAASGSMRCTAKASAKFAPRWARRSDASRPASAAGCSASRVFDASAAARTRRRTARCPSSRAPTITVSVSVTTRRPRCVDAYASTLSVISGSPEIISPMLLASTLSSFARSASSASAVSPQHRNLCRGGSSASRPPRSRSGSMSSASAAGAERRHGTRSSGASPAVSADRTPRLEQRSRHRGRLTPPAPCLRWRGRGRRASRRIGRLDRLPAALPRRRAATAASASPTRSHEGLPGRGEALLQPGRRPSRPTRFLICAGAKNSTGRGPAQALAAAERLPVSAADRAAVARADPTSGRGSSRAAPRRR